MSNCLALHADKTVWKRCRNWFFFNWTVNWTEDGWGLHWIWRWVCSAFPGLSWFRWSCHSLILIEIFGAFSHARSIFSFRSLCSSILCYRDSVFSCPTSLPYLVGLLAHSPWLLLPLFPSFFVCLQGPLIPSWKISWCVFSLLPFSSFIF